MTNHCTLAYTCARTSFPRPLHGRVVTDCADPKIGLRLGEAHPCCLSFRVPFLLGSPSVVPVSVLVTHIRCLFCVPVVLVLSWFPASPYPCVSQSCSFPWLTFPPLRSVLTAPVPTLFGPVSTFLSLVSIPAPACFSRSPSPNPTPVRIEVLQPAD